MGAESVSGVGFDTALALLFLGAVSVFVLKSFGFRGAPIVALVSAISVLSLYEPALRESSELITYLGEVSGARDYTRAALKVVGVSYLSGISRDIVTELGEGGIAKCISLVTRLELLFISLPFIKEMLATAISLAEG